MSEEEMRKEENLEHEVLDRLKSLDSTDFDYNKVHVSYVDAMLKARDIILDLYNKEKEKNKKAIEMLQEEIRFCEQEAKGHLNNEICHIALRFDKHLLQELLEGDK